MGIHMFGKLYSYISTDLSNPRALWEARFENAASCRTTQDRHYRGPNAAMEVQCPAIISDFVEARWLQQLMDFEVDMTGTFILEVDTKTFAMEHSILNRLPLGTKVALHDVQVLQAGALYTSPDQGMLVTWLKLQSSKPRTWMRWEGEEGPAVWRKPEGRGRRGLGLDTGFLAEAAYIVEQTEKHVLSQ